MLSPMKFTIEQFIEAVKEADSMSDVLKILGLCKFGSNFGMVKRYVKELKLDTSHWTGRKYLLTRKPSILGRTLSEVLIKDSNYNRKLLKNKLFKENIFKKECSSCKLTEWLNQPISLELDHINGINNDNRLENLRILCPNCHAQTPTYRGKNGRKIDPKICIGCNKLFTPDTSIRKYCSLQCYKPNIIKLDNNKIDKKIIQEINCKQCNKLFKPVVSNSKFCSKDCYHNSTKGLPKPTKIKWPTPEEMAKLVFEISSTLLAQKLGVSDKAVEKYCKKYNISKPPRGYWAKKYALKIPLAEVESANQLSKSCTVTDYVTEA